MSYPYGSAIRDRIAANLSGFERQAVDDAKLRRAAVVIVVAETVAEGNAHAGQACVLLTKRPETLRRHAGQFALPGGRIDGGETAAEAALRELAEELRVSLEPSAILGALDDFPTRSGFAITPFVAWGGPVAEIDPDPVEVARVFRIPFSDLDSPRIPHLTPGEAGRPPVMSAPLATTGGHVYAPTAAMLYQFREVAMHGRPTRVAHFDQPRFAWK